MVNFGVINRVYTKFDLGDKHSPPPIDIELHFYITRLLYYYETGKRITKV